MVVTDIISDMITTIRNGLLLSKESVNTPSSKLKINILKILQEKAGNRWLLKSDVTIEIEGKEKPAAIAETLALFVTTE